MPYMETQVNTFTSTRSRRTVLIFGLMLLLYGCADAKVKSPSYSAIDEFPSDELRSSFGTIAVVPSYKRPNIELNTSAYDKDECVHEARSAAIRRAGASCTGFFDCLFDQLVVGTLDISISSAAAAAEADTQEEVDSRVEHIEVKTGSSRLADRFQDRALELAHRYHEFTFQAIPEHQSTDQLEIPFDLLREQQIDTVLQLGITDIVTRATEEKYCDPKIELSIRTNLAIFDTADGSQIYSISMHRETESRKLEDWAKGDAKYWDAALNGYLDEVISGLLDAVLVHVNAPADIVPTGSLSRSSDVWVRVKDLRPTFAWAWKPVDRGSWTGEFSKYNSDVSYDLRVTSTIGGSIVYEKFGLGDTQHKMRKSLRPNGNFIWQIRANFLLNGKIRRTRWFGNFLIRT